jgi:maltooligosyltrehalose trehalohydrolase
MVSGKRAGTIPLHQENEGFFSGMVEDVADNDRYHYLLDNEALRPDPASRYQPEGVHGASQVVDPRLFPWHDQGWTGIPLQEYVIYELHVGTFTGEGTFEAVIPVLGYLKELGITALELMPVAQFPGERTWGYDGVCPFAPQNSYGGPDGLKRLIDACHAGGLAVILDVVYNHLGPEGNYLHGFGPYFTDRYRTPWGDAVNFDGPDSDPVRRYFISNALYWITEYHVDALRLDAVHAIYDFGALHILRELGEAAHRQGGTLGRRVHVIAESDLNDVRVINSPESGGYGLDAQWNDDFHHALHAVLTGERTGYFSDFGLFSHLVKSFEEGFVLSGEHSAFRRRRHGSSSAGVPPGKLVVFFQNHDQVGNRMRGDRPGEYLSVQQLKLAAATVLLSPYVPLLFMGEEYGESAPFPFFVCHGDAELVESVRRGRLEEFASFTHQGSPPDPQSEATFLSAKLDREQRHVGEHRAMFEFYRELIRLRREYAPLARPGREDMQIVACEEEMVLVVSRGADNVRMLCLFNYSDQTRMISPSLVGGTMNVILDSTGNSPPGSSVTVYATRPETFIKLAPFGVMVYRKEK